MGDFWGANQTEQRLREDTIHVYFACLQDTCGANVLNFLGLKKISTTFLRLPEGIRGKFMREFYFSSCATIRSMLVDIPSKEIKRTSISISIITEIATMVGGDTMVD